VTLLSYIYINITRSGNVHAHCYVIQCIEFTGKKHD
jgi:hypothetical protein